MFNGLIEELGEIVAVTPIRSGVTIGVKTVVSASLELGESVALNGVCLTVTDRNKTRFEAEISPETVRVTSLAGLAVGDLVNLERSMRADTRVGGHFVQGHVDGTGTVGEIRQEDEFHWVSINFAKRLAPYLVAKGSIAVDGISLTVAELGDESFAVQIIPFTWTHTALCRAEVGMVVNLECDIIGKYVARAFEIGAFRLSGTEISKTGDDNG